MQHVEMIVALVPIAILVWIMTKRNPVPSHQALPGVAVLLFLLRLVYFKGDPLETCAFVVSGLLTAWTPILIIAGAVFLFKTMELSGGMDVVRTWLNGLTRNRVAQLMIIAWAFAFLIEGASGFGTPAALAAPILVGLGFAPVRAAIVCLIMNSVPVCFGAVGTPTWFGLGSSELGLSTAELVMVGFRTAAIHGVAALVIPPIALLFVVGWREVRDNILFVYMSILSCVAPYLLLARFDCEFPSILGGMIGLLVSVFLAKKGIGLASSKEKGKVSEEIHARHLAKALFPLWGTILLLLVTRIRQFGIKSWLVSDTPSFRFPLGSLGDFAVSPSLVLSLQNIFGAGVGWSHKVLYVPSILPFVVVSLLACVLFKVRRKVVGQIFSDTCERMYHPVVALLGALVFVKLLMGGGEQACTAVIGRSLSELIGTKWPLFASYLGAVGSFFSGSNTVSNLTFGGIQNTIATDLGLDRLTILALQSVGGGMGNMVCINNIVAVCSILGLEKVEGAILKKTVIPMLLYGVIAAIAALLLF